MDDTTTALELIERGYQIVHERLLTRPCACDYDREIRDIELDRLERITEQLAWLAEHDGFFRADD